MASLHSASHRPIRRRLLTLAALAAAGAFGVIASANLTADARGDLIRTSPAMLAACAVVTAGTIVTLLWARPGNRRAPAPVLALAVSMAFGWDGPVLSALSRRAPATAGALAALRTRLPPGTPLVSLGPVHHRFAYLWGEPIPIHSGSTPPAGWFCFDADVEPGIAVDRVALSTVLEAPANGIGRPAPTRGAKR